LQLARKTTHLPKCLLMGPIWNFSGGPNSLSHGFDSWEDYDCSDGIFFPLMLSCVSDGVRVTRFKRSL